MSLPQRRDSLDLLTADLARRVRILEAKQPEGAGASFGQGVEVENSSGQSVTGTEDLEFTEVIDPYGFFSAASDDTKLIVPAGLAGAYHLSLSWFIGGE